MNAIFAANQWIVCQIGAREHYVLAAELHRRGQLAALCTDVWACEGSFSKGVADIMGSRGNKIRSRYDSNLRNARVLSESPVSMGCQALLDSIGGARHWNWKRILESNRRFAVNTARRLERSGILKSSSQICAVFAYSYAALDILESARQAGCKAVLGQIDPGPEEFALVSRLARLHGYSDFEFPQPPDQYWNEWRRECELADIIVVNSNWSGNLLARAGVSDTKIRIVPLAYRRAGGSVNPAGRRYPSAFTSRRPLKLLFLGQINLRKGALELIAAMRRLTSAPVRLQMVGPVDPSLRSRFDLPSNIEWIDTVSRQDVEEYYQGADVFILPTHSDGFAITQLEALGYGLPVIVSHNCGEVVLDGKNGRLLKSVTVDDIESQILWAINQPDEVAFMSTQAPMRLGDYAPEKVVDKLLSQALE